MARVPNDDMLRELGHVAVAASALEFQTAEVAHALLDENVNVGLAVTAGMTWQHLCGLVDNLAAIRLDPRGRASRLLTAGLPFAVEAMDERHKLLHGHWTGDGRVLTSKRPEPLIAMRDVDLPRLRSVSDRLYTARSVMWDSWYGVVKECGYGVETDHRWSWPDREPLEQHELDLKKLKRRRPKPPLVRPHPVEEDPSGERTTGYTVDL